MNSLQNSREREEKVTLAFRSERKLLEPRSVHGKLKNGMKVDPTRLPAFVPTAYPGQPHPIFMPPTLLKVEGL